MNQGGALHPILKGSRWGQAHRKGGEHSLNTPISCFFNFHSFFLRMAIYSLLILPIKFNFTQKASFSVFCIHFCTLEFGIVLVPREGRKGGGGGGKERGKEGGSRKGYLIVVQSTGLGVRWSGVPRLQLTSCMTLNKLLTLYVP